METIFSKIIRGDIPCYKIAENDNYFAFLDINPLAEGHTLVIPKKQTDNIFDINEAEYAGLFLFAKKIALSIQKNFECKKVGIAVIGLEVAHAHIHLVPINSVSDLDFKREKLKLSDKRFNEIVKKITKDLEL